MACVFPGAAGLRQYWENILQKFDAISDPPPGWEAELYFDPEADSNDRTYCKRGGFLGKLAEFDPFAYGILPNAIDGSEIDHFMALRVAHDALADSGVQNLEQVKDRTAVIIGRGTYINRGNAAALQQGVMVESVLRILKQLHPGYDAEQLAEIKRRLKAGLPGFNADTAPGLVPNIISGRIANRLDLMGPNYLVDAACASSLVAIEMAARELLTGRCDLAIAGGSHSDTSAVLVEIFSGLRALSRRGELRAFDEGADGTLLGEGVGMVVLKRLEEAERDGNCIYALLRGIGIASDGRALGVLAPRVEGEETALRRAYKEADVDPATIGLLEAHGTGTPLGDLVEVQALRRVFPDRKTESPRCALGSVKTMISHTMPAAGSAALIKTALALHHKVLPATLHCEKPNPKLELENTNFYINTETRPWIHGASGYPRRAGVNAFGFGGINAHAVLEEYTGPNQAPWLQHQWDSELLVFSGDTREALLAEVRRVRQSISESAGALPLKNLAWTLNCHTEHRSERLAVVVTSHDDAIAKLDRAIKRLSDARTKSIKEIEGIYFFQEPLGRQGKLAFVFPGEGSQYRNMLWDLCIHFPEVRQVFDLMDRAYENHGRDYLPSDVIFPAPLGSPSEQRLWNMDSGAETVFAANQAMLALMQKLGIRADAMVGHSTGEHSALLASNTVQVDDDAELIDHILGVYEVFDKLNASSGIPEAVLLAIAGADHAMLEKRVADSGGDLYIALDNCIHQVVLCGKESVIDQLVESLKGTPAICQKLPFGRAYHTPWFEVFSKPLRSHFDRLRIGKPQVDLYSCVTASRYPSDPGEIKTLASVQWSSSVRYRETTEAMYRDGIRIFLEVGPRSNLTGFIDDVLRGKAHAAVAANVQHRSGILQLHHMLAQLVAHGLNPRLEVLYERRAPAPLNQQAAGKKRSVNLPTGLQPLRLPSGFSLPGKPAARPVEPTPAPAPLPAAPSPAPVSTRQAVLDQHMRTMEQFLAAEQQIMSTYLAGRRRPAPSSPVVAPAPQLFPFITETIELVPGVSARARHTFSLSRDRIFYDHTLGRDVSVSDPSLLGLPMVPLTVTMEILAECGALLEPGRLVVGLRDIRATRWITLEKPGYTIELEAKRRSPGVVHVTLREAGDTAAVRPIFAEATVVFSNAYPDPGPPNPFILEGEHNSSWKPDQLYRTGMFHGPLMQGTKSVERAGRNGTSATIEALPHSFLFAGNPAPNFLFDPVLLDAAGQVVAYWFWEAIERGTDLFPYRVAAFHCYAPSPPTGTQLECRVVRRSETDKVIHSDIEVLDRQGKVYYRLENWETRRFRQPPRFLHLRVDPKQAFVSTQWNASLSIPQGGPPVICCRVEELTHEFLDSSHGVWLKTLAYLALSARERQVWDSMQAVSKRRHEWLLGRCAAKDAVRLLLREQKGVELCAADVEIIPDAYGRPHVEGPWKRQLGVEVSVSITHSSGVAAAVATLGNGLRVGFDLEHSGRERGRFEDLAFAEEEKRLLESLSEDLRDAWALRLWCAKEAVAKALGKGFSHGFTSVRIDDVAVDTGRANLKLDGELLSEFPEFRDKSITAQTRQVNGFLSALVLLPEENPN
jgi:acyl transferase domain-containing protein/phosphopantetheinyl transferase (holo-ACP synthase)